MVWNLTLNLESYVRISTSWDARRIITAWTRSIHQLLDDSVSGLDRLWCLHIGDGMVDERDISTVLFDNA